MLSPHAIFEFTLPSPSRTKLPRTAGNSPRRKSSRVSSPSSPLITELSDVSLGYNIDKIMICCLRGEDVSDCHPSIFPELIDKLWDQWDFLHRNGWEREADEAFRGYKMAKAAQIESQRKFYQCHLQKDLMARKKEANDELEVLEKKTDVIEKNMHIAHQKDRMALETKQKQEIDDFNKEWMNSKTRMYNKTSSYLRELRMQQDQFLERKLYKESEDARKFADKLEKEEMIKASKSMEYDYKMALQPITAQHQNEMKTLIKAQQDEKRVYESAKKSEIDLINQKLKKLNNEFEKSKDMRYIARRQLCHTSRTPQAPNYKMTTKLNRAIKKDVNVSSFNEVPIQPFAFRYIKKNEQENRKSYVHSPRSNVAKRIIYGE